MVEFGDGNLSTSWPDFGEWYLDIADPNDTDRDGIPDLSDPSPENAVASIRLPKTANGMW